MSVQLSVAAPPKLASVPAFPTVVMRLLSLLGDERSGMAAIAACIATDPVIAARVLKRANAADQARSEVRDVLQAILALGVDRTREVTLTTATLAYAGSAMEMELLRPCWHHTVATAVLASEIAKLCGLSPAEPYTAGLLHDIGRLGLLKAYPSEYAEIMQEADGCCDGLLNLERVRFGVDHTEAGVWLARKWNLPDSIAEVAARHHETPSGPIGQLVTVQIACRMADLLGFSIGHLGSAANFDEIAAPLPMPVRNRLCNRIPALQDQVLEQIAFFGRVEASKLTAPLEVVIDEEESESLSMEIPVAVAGESSFLRRAAGRSVVLLALVLLIAAVLRVGH